MVTPDPVRRIAYRVIRQVNGEDGYANLVLGQALRAAGISGRDAAFCTELVHGTLRWQGTYDAVLARCVNRPLERVDPELLDLLRLGTHQLLRMRVTTYAAVSETVTLTRSQLGKARAGLVNGVLRSVSRYSFDGWVRHVAPDDPIGRLEITHGHPRWIIEAFAAALGGSHPISGVAARQAAPEGTTSRANPPDRELVRLLEADNEPPRVTLVARPGLATIDELTSATPGRWSPYAAVLPSGDPGDIPAVAEGRAGVQDEGSQLVALALADAPLDGRDERWLDLCAGPGGKSALLAALGVQRGVTLTAVEPQPHRADLVRANLRAVPGEHEVLVADGTVRTWPDGRFDRVLADVPCTGLGALRRRPEARWRRRPEDVVALRTLQERLLDSALDSIRIGGLAAYVTCSPHPEETRAVVTSVLTRRGDASMIDARPLMPDMPELGDGPDVQLWPHRHGTDAMYLALVERRE